MKKFGRRKWKIQPVPVERLSDRMLLANLYATQLLIVIIGFVWIILQGRSVFSLLAFPENGKFALWAAGLAAAALIGDGVVSRFLPAEAMDDGGVNERLFRRRPVWHIALIALVVSVCEEVLFRGAIQYAFGPYWTSVLFAAIHVRYLRHWVPTGMLFLVSYGLGWIMIESGTIWAPILAHFLFDFIMGLIIRFRRES